MTNDWAKETARELQLGMLQGEVGRSDIVNLLREAFRRGEERMQERASELCQIARDAFDKGAGSAHSSHERYLCQSQCEWLRDEIRSLPVEGDE